MVCQERAQKTAKFNSLTVLAGLTLHLFTRREAGRLLKKAGFRLLEVRPVALKPDGVLPSPGWFGWLRAYGYLLAAERTM
jgi:hypothetical protein